MFIDWIVFVLLMVLFLGFIMPGRRKGDAILISRTKFYLKDIAFSVVVVGFFYGIKGVQFFSYGIPDNR